MNDLEKLIYLHDPRGDATTFLLTKEEMQEFINAAIAVGQDSVEPIIETEDLLCNDCGIRDAEYCEYCLD